MKTFSTVLNIRVTVRHLAVAAWECIPSVGVRRKTRATCVRACFCFLVDTLCFNCCEDILTGPTTLQTFCGLGTSFRVRVSLCKVKH